MSDGPKYSEQEINKVKDQVLAEYIKQRASLERQIEEFTGDKNSQEFTQLEQSLAFVVESIDRRLKGE
jgi:hypothetical protein